MTDLDPTEVVGVMRSDLQEILAALDWARGQNEALDLAERYRQGTATYRGSRLTASLNRSYSKVLGYLDTKEEDDE